jgi:molecular chaperone GrpE
MAKKSSSDSQKLVDLEQKWKRALADYANLEKRIAVEKTELCRLLTEPLIKELLTIIDELEMAQAHLQDQGLALTLSKFKQILANQGVSEIPVMGLDYDPLSMEVSQMVAGSKNKVVKVILQGYQLNNKIIRPARVQVGQGGKQNE